MVLPLFPQLGRCGFIDDFLNSSLYFRYFAVLNHELNTTTAISCSHFFAFQDDEERRSRALRRHVAVAAAVAAVCRRAPQATAAMKTQGNIAAHCSSANSEQGYSLTR